MMSAYYVYIYSPGPREIPGCTGSCQLTHCPACYFSVNRRPLPGSCRTCGTPVSTQHCLRKWAYCVGRANVRKYGRVSQWKVTYMFSIPMMTALVSCVCHLSCSHQKVTEPKRISDVTATLVLYVDKLH